MPKVLISEKRAKPAKATLKSKSHIKGREGHAGHEDRLKSYIKRTMELKRDGHYLGEIAQIIATEYNLELVPHISTVAKWRQNGLDAVNADIIQLQEVLRHDQLQEIHALKSKWMPIAMAAHLEIKRWVMIEGELQPELDEDAVAEQLKATKEVINLMAREAKLMGLDMEKALPASGEGPTDLQALQVWIINQVSEKTAPGKVIDVEVLSLDHGLPDVGDSV